MAGTADPDGKTQAQSCGTHLPALIWYFPNRVLLQFLTVLPKSESLHDDVSQGNE